MIDKLFQSLNRLVGRFLDVLVVRYENFHDPVWHSIFKAIIQHSFQVLANAPDHGVGCHNRQCEFLSEEPKLIRQALEDRLFGNIEGRHGRDRDWVVPGPYCEERADRKMFEDDQLGTQRDRDRSRFLVVQPIVAVPIQLRVIQRTGEDRPQAGGGADQGAQERGGAARERGNGGPVLDQHGTDNQGREHYSQVTKDLKRQLYSMRTLFTVSQDLNRVLDQEELVNVVSLTLLGEIQISSMAVFSLERENYSAFRMLGVKGFDNNKFHGVKIERAGEFTQLLQRGKKPRKIARNPDRPAPRMNPANGVPRRR